MRFRMRVNWVRKINADESVDAPRLPVSQLPGGFSGGGFGGGGGGGKPPPVAPPGTRTFTTAGAGTWTVPVGVTSVLVECYGGGGGGANKLVGQAVGGGGGAYASKVIAVKPGTTINFIVGAGGAGGAVGGDNLGTAGTDTSWNAGQVLAKGGKAALVVDLQTSGGMASGCVGDVKRSGGGAQAPSAGGGGGGSSGSRYAGGMDASGIAMQAGAGRVTGLPCPTDAGAGGNALDGNRTGAQPGGGGGGSSVNDGGAAGGIGLIRVTWPPT